MKLKNFLATFISCLIPIGMGFLLSLIFIGDAISYFVMFSIGFSVVALIVLSIIANKYNVKLDLHTYDSSSNMSMLLNDIFMGLLMAIPICLFTYSFL